MRRVYFRPWIAAVVLAVASACGSDSTSPQATATGSWSLQTINGSGLPTTIGSGVQAVTIIGSILTISPNGSYNEIVTLRVAGSSSTSTFTEVGTWTATNGLITFNDQTDQIQYTGSVSGNTLTESASGFTSVYARQ